MRRLPFIFFSLLTTASQLFANTMAGTEKSGGFLSSIVPPEDISINGHLIDWLFNYVTYAATFFFTLVCIGIFGFVYLYRHKKHKNAHYTHGDKKSHLIFVSCAGLAVFIAIDMMVTSISNRDYLNVFANWPNADKEDVVRIQVMAQQWMWKFRYAGSDGQFNTEDDVVTLNDLRLPINKKVVFQLTSKDVIHSFFLPNARRKVDAMPGRISRMWVELSKPGYWNIACAEMCGTHHYLMKAYLTTYKPQDFDRWYNEAKIYAKVENDPENKELFWGWPWKN